MERAEILISGVVQGVGFRYFVLRLAHSLGLKGFTRNLYSGEVIAVAEGEKFKIEEFFNQIKIGPSHAFVKHASIKWSESKNEFNNFEIRY